MTRQLPIGVGHCPLDGNADRNVCNSKNGAPKSNGLNATDADLLMDGFVGNIYRLLQRWGPYNGGNLPKVRSRYCPHADFGSAVQVQRKSILSAALLMCPPPTWVGKFANMDPTLLKMTSVLKYMLTDETL